MSTRNILLTTLGNTYDYMRHSYFMYQENNTLRYCEGISTAEAGAKYILSKVPIDKIIVLGPSSAFQDENINQEERLRDLCCFGYALPENYSEYKFFCYRIMQYLNRIDIEGSDILDSVSEEEQAFLKTKLKEYCMAHGYQVEGKIYLDELFQHFNTDQEDFEKLMETIPDATNVQRRWIKHYLFMCMNKYYKMKSLSDNEGITVQFVPTIPKGENNLRMGNLPSILEHIMGGEKSNVKVYVDLQGMDIADSHTLINVLFMLQNEKTKNIDIEEIITTTYRPSLFTNPIENQKNRLELSELLSGMDAFLQYGKVDSIRRYWQTRNIHDDHVEHLIYAMQTLDIGISLCSVSEIENGIRMLKMVFADQREQSNMIESMIFHILEIGILDDYGSLLKDDEINILELIKWSIQKHFYQQALTIIESRVPYDLVRSGIFYYAIDDETRQEFMDRLNVAYWATQLKDRYQFDDLEHFFIKFYRRREAYQNKSEELTPMETYIALRLDEIYIQENAVKSYTRYKGSRQVLYDFLMMYMKIGSLRNQISHAQEIESSIEEWNIHQENQKIASIKETMYEFIRLYEELRGNMDMTKPTPVMITEAELKEYFHSHKLKWNNKQNKNGNKNNNSDNNSKDNNGKNNNSDNNSKDNNGKNNNSDNNSKDNNGKNNNNDNNNNTDSGSKVSSNKDSDNKGNRNGEDLNPGNNAEESKQLQEGKSSDNAPQGNSADSSSRDDSDPRNNRRATKGRRHEHIHGNKNKNWKKQ